LRTWAARSHKRARLRGVLAETTRIAEELGVSAMTVSNAYNHPDRLSEALRERIFETAGRLGYQGPDPVGRSLRRQRTDVVRVLYSNPLSYAFDDPAAVSFLGGLSSVTEEADVGLLLVPAAGGGASGERNPRAAAQAAVDGFVIYSMSEEEPLLAAALDRQLPAVVVDQPFKENGGRAPSSSRTREVCHRVVRTLTGRPGRDSEPSTPGTSGISRERSKAAGLPGCVGGSRSALVEGARL
jgi:DNA-binding LacI/PurR family transcriptional regulator